MYNKGSILIRHNTFHYKGDKLSSYNSCRPLTKDELFLLLYIDDGAIILINRQEAILGPKIIFLQMKRMGLNMDVGIGDKKFKTDITFLVSFLRVAKYLYTRSNNIIIGIIASL